MSGSTVIPILRYRDARAAIDWLCRVFGFEPRLIVPGPGESVVHGQLQLGGGMLMLATVREEDATLRQPDQVGGVETQVPYLVVADPDQLHDRARAAGATIVLAPMSPEHGGRLFSCRDPEGHLWHVGSYDPWLPPEKPA